MASKSKKTATGRGSGSSAAKGGTGSRSARAGGSRGLAAERAPARRSPEDAEVARLKALLELMQEHGLVELEIGADGHSVRMSKVGPAPTVSVPSYGMVPGHVAMPAAPASAPAAAAAPDGSAPPADPNLSFFLSPMVGTFYRAASPEAAPYSVVGDRVGPDTTLCIIEAMKVFNEIKAEMSGTITDVLVENGEAVEYGQPLFAIKK